MWKLSNALLKKQSVKDKIRREIFESLETKIKTQQKKSKISLSRKFRGISAGIDKKEELKKINK